MLPASSRSLRVPFLFLVLGVIAVIAVACGGGDESPEEPPPATEAPATEVAAAAESDEAAAEETAVTETSAAASEGASEGSAVEGSPVDVQYLRALCLAGNDLQTAMFTAAIRMETEGVDPEDPEAFGELFVEPLAGFLEAMRGVTPPDDVADYHTAALAQYEALVNLFASIQEGEEMEGDPFELLGGMLGAAEEIPVIPEAALDRLAGVSEGIPECEGSIFLPAFLGQVDTGDIDTGSEGGQTSEPDPEAEDYVRQLCLAGDDYEAAIQEAVAGMGPDAELDESDPEVFAAVFREALRGLAETMAGISPPADIAEYHDAAAARFGEMVVVLDGIMETLDAGREVSAQQLARFQELLGGGIGMPGLPLSVANRFGQAANSVIECYNSGFLYGFLSGGQ